MQHHKDKIFPFETNNHIDLLFELPILQNNKSRQRNRRRLCIDLYQVQASLITGERNKRLP